MTPEIHAWCMKHHVSSLAVDELIQALNPVTPIGTGFPTSEAAVQATIRLESPRYGALWRNNNGVATDGDRHIRYGLANDSKKINSVFKSSDLIGITSVLVEPHHVGRHFGVFTAAEVKKSGWKLLPSDETGQAQQNFLMTVRAMGGIGCFAPSKDDYINAIERFKKW